MCWAPFLSDLDYSTSEMTGPAVKCRFLAEPELSIWVFYCWLFVYWNPITLRADVCCHVRQTDIFNIASKMAATTRDILFHFNIVTDSCVTNAITLAWGILHWSSNKNLKSTNPGSTPAGCRNNSIPPRFLSNSSQIADGGSFRLIRQAAGQFGLCSQESARYFLFAQFVTCC